MRHWRRYCKLGPPLALPRVAPLSVSALFLFPTTPTSSCSVFLLLLHVLFLLLDISINETLPTAWKGLTLGYSMGRIRPPRELDL